LYSHKHKHKHTAQALPFLNVLQSSFTSQEFKTEEIKLMVCMCYETTSNSNEIPKSFAPYTHNNQSTFS